MIKSLDSVNNVKLCLNLLELRKWQIGWNQVDNWNSFEKTLNILNLGDLFEYWKLISCKRKYFKIK